MELWQIIAAVLQGLVEWLPISSEGQVILFLYNFSSIPVNELLTVVVWLHLGTALAVIVRYPQQIIQILTYKDKILFRNVLIATVCTAITAIPLYFVLKTMFTGINAEAINVLVGVLLLITAVLLYLPIRKGVGVEEKEVDDQIAATTGIVQGFAVLPGLSRSGVTISALLMQKVDKERALAFSFIISVPAVFGILAIEILTGGASIPTIPLSDLVVMEIVVFVTALASMEFLLRLARRVAFWKLCLFLAVVAILFGLPALF